MTFATERLARHFDLEARGSTVGTELRAGLVTFLTMAYILVVNAQILADAGMPRQEVVAATALGAAVATLVMGLWADYPFALAPGMGINAYFAYAVVGGMGLTWQQALTAVLVAGLLFLLLGLGRFREMVVKAIPAPVKIATMGGIGLFLALIGMRSAGLVVGDPATLVSLGPVTRPEVWLSLLGLVGMTVLASRKVPGAVLFGILGVAGLAWIGGLSPLPEAVLGTPVLPRETWLAFDLAGLTSSAMITAILAFLFVDLFDTVGTLIGVGRLGGFTDEEGNLPRANRAFFADALGTTVGAMLGTSPVTSYIESSTGIEEGGRTGLTAVTVAVLFVLSLVFVPFLAAIPAIATAPALILVGALMMAGLRDIDWGRVEHAVPAFLTMVTMPFTYSITHGVSLGLVSYTAIQVVRGRPRDVHPLVIALSILLVLFYATLLAGS